MTRHVPETAADDFAAGYTPVLAWWAVAVTMVFQIDADVG